MLGAPELKGLPREREKEKEKKKGGKGKKGKKKRENETFQIPEGGPHAIYPHESE